MLIVKKLHLDDVVVTLQPGGGIPAPPMSAADNNPRASIEMRGKAVTPREIIKYSLHIIAFLTMKDSLPEVQNLWGYLTHIP